MVERRDHQSSSGDDRRRGFEQDHRIDAPGHGEDNATTAAKAGAYRLEDGHRVAGNHVGKIVVRSPEHCESVRPRGDWKRRTAATILPAFGHLQERPPWKLMVRWERFGRASASVCSTSR